MLASRDNAVDLSSLGLYLKIATGFSQKSLLTKSHCQCRRPPLKLLAKGIPGHLRTTQTLIIALGCPPELDNKPQLTKTPHTLVKGHEEIKN